MRRKWWRRLIMAVVILLAVAESTAAAQDLPENPARLMQMVGEGGEPLLSTGLAIHAGDRFIAPDNNVWRVYKVEGDRAVARKVATLTQAPSPREMALVRQPVLAAAVRRAAPDMDVVVYHTHSDEAYIPTDGTDSVNGKGGIYSVGASLVRALEAEGLRAAQRQENHNPRDSGAYIRSRRTALEALVEQQPAVIFDIHRDATPAEAYKHTHDGEIISKVLIVIGGANPARDGNLAFARLLKAKADELVPGLVRGIYVGVGNYNQDTYTRNLLLEAGSHYTPREEAERGVALLAAAIAPVLQEAGLPGSPVYMAENRAAWRAIGWVLALLLLFGGGALILIAGGWRPALGKLARWREQLWDPRERR